MQARTGRTIPTEILNKAQAIAQTEYVTNWQRLFDRVGCLQERGYAGFENHPVAEVPMSALSIFFHLLKLYQRLRLFLELLVGTWEWADS